MQKGSRGPADGGEAAEDNLYIQARCPPSNTSSSSSSDSSRASSVSSCHPPSSGGSDHRSSNTICNTDYTCRNRRRRFVSHLMQRVFAACPFAIQCELGLCCSREGGSEFTVFVESPLLHLRGVWSAGNWMQRNRAGWVKLLRAVCRLGAQPAIDSDGGPGE